MIILYSNNCPQCKMLEQQLTKFKIAFYKNTNLEEMQVKGFTSAPKIELEDGTILNTAQALQWIKNGG